MKCTYYLFCILSLFGFKTEQTSEKIETTLLYNGSEQKGHILVDFKNNLSPVVSFHLKDDQVSDIFNALSPICKRLIGLGFVQQSDLDNSLNAIDLKLQRSNESISVYKSNKQQNLEAIKNNTKNVLIGASVYEDERLSEKIIFKYKNQKLIECQLRTNYQINEHSLNLKFNFHD